MYQYTIAQWILFFGWYCFLGWVWESCYVSAVQAWKNKRFRFVNRGFLNGPFLPIYGFAAIVILIATIPVKEKIWMVYVFGALAATLMELVTGSSMERLFKVKYWDYSNLPLNFHGYICFFISLFWGGCAVLLTEVLHVPAEKVMAVLPGWLTELAAVVFVAYFAYDFSISFHEAMDMREILERLTENNESLQRLERRFDAVVAFTPVPDVVEKGRNVKEKIIDRVEANRERRVERIRKMRERLSNAAEGEFLDKEELMKQTERLIRNIFSRSDRQYLRAVRHLRRNPGAVSKKYAEALKEIKNLFEK